MGHTRLGKIPTTRRWRDVVGIFATAKSATGPIAESNDVARLASSTIRASGNALQAGIKDGGLAFIYYLLTQLALSARRENPRKALQELGLNLPAQPTHLDL